MVEFVTHIVIVDEMIRLTYIFYTVTEINF